MSELLRRAGQALIDSPPSRPIAVAELQARAARHGRRRQIGRSAAAVGVVGLFVGALSLGTLNGNEPQPDGSGVAASNPTIAPSPSFAPTTPTSPPAAVAAPTTIGPVDGVDSQPLCGDFGCGPWTPIPIAAGVADYYVPAADLGEAVVNEEFHTAALRCAEIDSDGVCQQVEGLAGLPLVSVRLSDATGGLGDYDAASTGLIGVGTTFADITAQQYAEQWAVSGAGVAELTPTVVRGHDAITWDYGSSVNVAWQERPGVLAWVTVSTDLQSRLLEIAEGLVQVAGPTERGIAVVVPGSGPAWTAADNSGTGLLIARFEALECGGWQSVQSCGSIAATPISTRNGSLVYGDAQGAAEIEATGVYGTTARAALLTTPTFTRQVFVASLPQDLPASIKFLDSSGQTMAAEAFPPPSELEGKWAPTSGRLGATIASGRTGERLWWLGADLDADDAIASQKGQSSFFRPDNAPILCAYFNLTETYRVVCTAPGDLTMVGRVDGFVFGSVGPGAATVTVDGVEVELLSDGRIVDRRFFVASDGDLKILDASGHEIAPAPIVASSS